MSSSSNMTTPPPSDEYARLARFYDTLLGPLNEGLRGLAFKLYPPRAGMRVLDVCCGTGVQLEMYRREGCVTFGIDKSPSMLQRAQGRTQNGGSFVLGDVRNMPYGDGEFDLVLCTLSIHEMEPADRPVVMREIARVVGPDGRVLLTDFHPGPARFFKGWVSAAVIRVAERTAGRRHFRCFRHFIRTGGLKDSVFASGLWSLKEKIVGGGTFVVWLLAPPEIQNS